jgi:HK97 family phage prohead protease
MSTMTANSAEARVLGIELRDVETDDKFKELYGRAVPYGVQTDIGWFLESFARGSLAKSTKESAAALPLLMFHNDMALPVGSARKWEDKPDGLWGTWRLAGTREAQEAAELAHDGHLNFMSIRFQPIRSTWTFVEDLSDITAKDSVERHEARLIEVSLVSTPAYNDATVKWVRSFEAQRRDVDRTPSLDAWKTELERLKGNR